MELRSVAYNSIPEQGMPEMSEMQGMSDMGPGMQGMHMPHGMYPQGGYVPYGVNAEQGYAGYDPCAPCAPVACTVCGTPVMPPFQPCPPMPSPPPSPAPRVYVVKKGDSVYKIAKRFGTTMEAIIAENNLRNPELIYPGQILLIPTGCREYKEEYYG